MAIRPVPEGGSRASASPAYERVPPHNIEAEESVLGSMLLSKDAIAEVLELLREDDFYRPAHRTVFRSVLELYGHGDAVDAVTVQEELRRSGRYLVLTPDECVEFARTRTDVSLKPLMGGVDPAIGWRSMELFVEQVVPRLNG